MSLQALAYADNKYILENASGFTGPVKLTDLATPTPHVYNLTGFNLRIGVDVDPETGLLVQGNKTAISVHLSNFSLSNLPDADWPVEATDITGALVKGKATNVMLDRSLGFATILFKK